MLDNTVTDGTDYASRRTNGRTGKTAAWVSLRNSLLWLLTALALSVVYRPLKDLVGGPGRSEYYSHIVLIPVASAYLVFRLRKVVGEKAQYAIVPGIILLGVGLAMLLAAFWLSGRLSGRLEVNDYASLSTFGGITAWTGVFVLLYGAEALRIARFPVLFLLFMVPVPVFLMDPIIRFLQVGSTEATELLFRMVGLDYLREGLVFQLPNINIEVAKECSGIRSTIGLVITSVLAGHLLLDSGWRKLVLVLAVFPITILKNAIRIATLSLLAVHVDTRFITESWLHHSGGIVFYIPALGLMALVLNWLRGRLQRKSNEHP